MLVGSQLGLPAEPWDPMAFVTRLPRHGAVLRPSVTLWLTNSASESLRSEAGAVLAALTPPTCERAAASEDSGFAVFPRDPPFGSLRVQQTKPFGGWRESSASPHSDLPVVFIKM